MVRLYRNGDIVKLSKRTGETITLRELMDEVGVDAARYFFCMRSLDSQLDFDMTLATEKSNENPVYYIQYAHARICSIARQLAEAGIEAVALDELKLDTLQAPEELALVKKLGEYPELLARAARERAVHHVATYTYELATLFHSFYNQCRIRGRRYRTLTRKSRIWLWLRQLVTPFVMHWVFWAFLLRKECNLRNSFAGGRVLGLCRLQ